MPLYKKWLGWSFQLFIAQVEFDNMSAVTKEDFYFLTWIKSSYWSKILNTL